MLHQGIYKRSISLVFAVFQPLVEAADILTAKALDDDDHHILLALHERIRRGMDRRIDGIELLLRIVIRHYEYWLVDGTDDGERSIQYDGSLLRTVYILIGIADGDRANCRGETSTHTCYAERYKHRQTKKMNAIISQQSLWLIRTGSLNWQLALWHAIKKPQACYQDDANQHQIPMVENLNTKDSTQILLVSKLREHGNRGTARGVFKINTIHQIGYNADGIADYEHPLRHLLIPVPLLVMDRKSIKSAYRALV